ncbi:class I SAM-dependent methyltransferase [soil metagenome]
MDKYKITFETWNKIASLYQDKFMHLDLYDDTYDKFCSLLEKSNSILFEIGCGPGNITKYLLSKRLDFKIDAIDVAPNMIELAKENNPSATFEIMDCREIDKINKTFDGIVCGFCLPYLSKEDCCKLIKDCSTLLNVDGVIYLSAIEGDYSKSGFELGSSGDKSYVYYHQEEYLQYEFNKNNFDIVEVYRKKYSKSSAPHLIMIAKKIKNV